MKNKKSDKTTDKIREIFYRFSFRQPLAKYAAMLTPVVKRTNLMNNLSYHLTEYNFLSGEDRMILINFLESIGLDHLSFFTSDDYTYLMFLLKHKGKTLKVYEEIKSKKS